MLRQQQLPSVLRRTPMIGGARLAWIVVVSGMRDWTTDFFTPVALDAWQRSLSSEATQSEVEFLAAALALGSEPRRLLDVPCGDGRHAVALAQLGHAVTGVDIAVDNVRRAAQRANDARVTIDFHVGDMRVLPDRPPFDGAYCLGNSFGYFPRAETQRFLGTLAQTLVPGARFVIDTACAAESILLDLNRQSWLRVDEALLVLLHCEYDPRESRLDTTYTSVVDGRVADERIAHNYIFTTGELVAMLDAVGFSTLDLLGDLDGSEFELGSERLLLVAERR
jgi:SAM-dependent methyltransferase